MTGRFGLMLSAATLVTGAVLSAIPAQALDGVAGPYLSARQAEIRGDVAEAARQFSRALSRDPENSDLMERAMTHQIAAGNVPDGIALARDYDKVAPGHHLGILALAADGIKKDRADDVVELLSDNAPFVGQIMQAWAAYGAGDVDIARTLLEDLEASDENGRPGQIVSAYHLGLLEAHSATTKAPRSISDGPPRWPTAAPSAWPPCARGRWRDWTGMTKPLR
ncbi:MAG: hypothetical protein AAF334_03060 [Pseudomonadota bacterium]